MRRTSSLTSLFALVAPLALATYGCGSDSTPEVQGGTTSSSSSTGGPSVDEVMGHLPKSCAFQCGTTCEEPAKPYECPTTKDWKDVPHADACAAWDGTYPTPVKGQCTSSDATGEAAQPAGPIPGGLVLPDGHRILPAGREQVFDEAELVGGFPMSILPIPGSRFALASDGGIKTNALRVIDLDALAGNGKPVSGYVEFAEPTSLFYGLTWLPPNRALASGGGDGVVYAFDVDTTKGTVVRRMDQDITLPKAGGTAFYIGAIAATKDGSRLVVGPSQTVDAFQIVSLGAADYGTVLATIDTGTTRSVFDVRLDPFDPAGKTFYASDQTNSQLLELDAMAGTITRKIALDKNPSQIAFLDAQYLVVTESDHDQLAVVDRVSGMVASHVDVFESKSPHGFSPTALTYDAVNKRLYATLASINAIEAYDVGASSPPTITPAGRIPTAWWPTAVMADTDGSLVVLNGKGHGTGTDDTQYTWGSGPITKLMRGSVQHVPAASLSSLSALSATVDKTFKLSEVGGAPAVTCPPGADDFPIPKDTTSGPSKEIKRVVLIIRENKTFDAIFGDMPGVNGDPKLIMGTDTQIQAKVWQNARAIAKTFTNFDNFYTDAEQSIQGHVWTVYGRTTDYMERSWLSTWGRATRPVGMPTSFEATPEERGIFDWLDANGIPNDDMGEAIGSGKAGIDGKYPGLLIATDLPDVQKTCYIAGRLRVRCDLKPFTYALQPNDHTNGGAAGAAAPEVMIAVNDEASGMLIDAFSRSPYWKDSLVIITEDDPQDGGDHVDVHRSIMLMASPWVKRGYVSHGHYDMASVYKLIAHIYGIPYHNEMIREALLPVDAFTSTPDYTPFTYLPRTVTALCNGQGTKHAKKAEAAHWDFADLDDQPGLSEQIMEMMKEPRAARGVEIIER
jgi:hypothetical protein